MALYHEFMEQYRLTLDSEVEVTTDPRNTMATAMVRFPKTGKRYLYDQKKELLYSTCQEPENWRKYGSSFTTVIWDKLHTVRQVFGSRLTIEEDFSLANERR